MGGFFVAGILGHGRWEWRRGRRERWSEWMELFRGYRPERKRRGGGGESKE
jgi:hypothetical protein